VDEQLQFLVDLQKLDTSILNLRLKIESAPSALQMDEAPYKEALKSFEAARQQQQSLEKKKKDKERLIDDLTEKIKKLRARSPEIKTNKEYQANLKEIESVEADIRSAEDDILAIMEIIDTAAKRTEAENSLLAEAKAKAEALIKEKKQEVSILEKDLSELKNSRKEFAEKIESDLYSLYMNLLKSNRGLAVSVVQSEICGGCNMNVPPQLFLEIKNGDKIFQCPQCRRILYFETPAEENRSSEVAQ